MRAFVIFFLVAVGFAYVAAQVEVTTLSIPTSTNGTGFGGNSQQCNCNTLQALQYQIGRVLSSTVGRFMSAELRNSFRAVLDAAGSANGVGAGNGVGSSA